VQRQTADLSIVRAALTEELSAQRKAAASAPVAVPQPAAADVPPAVEPQEEVVPPEPVAPEPAPADPPVAAGPRTHPIVLPQVDVAELGVADRLGLSDADDEEVGPTS
jgi:cell division transport system ATP-binding protein